jgi:radical SAM protein with 4Fe4S-binding SPASM domain
MSFNNFRKIIDEIGAYLYRVDLHNWGEPLLNDELYKMIAYARSHDIQVRVSSNLNGIDRTKAEKLVKSGLDVLIVSLDGASQETYAQYRVGGRFNKVTSGIKMINELKKELNVSKPSIVWQFLVMKHNENEILKAKRMSRELGVDELDFLAIHCDMGREIFWDRKTRFEKTANWLPRNKEFRMYNLATGEKKNRPKTCNFLWAQSAINWNGSVSPCCASYDEKYDFGNTFEINFKDVWNNDKYRQARRIVQSKKTGKNDRLIVCYYCVKNGFI